MKDSTCKNCGRWSGLHRFQTYQCHANGNEDNTYLDSKYEYDGKADKDARIAELEAENEKMRNALHTAALYAETTAAYIRELLKKGN